MIYELEKENNWWRRVVSRWQNPPEIELPHLIATGMP